MKRTKIITEPLAVSDLETDPYTDELAGTWGDKLQRAQVKQARRLKQQLT